MVAVTTVAAIMELKRLVKTSGKCEVGDTFWI